MKRKISTWFASLNAFYQFLVVASGTLAIVAAGLSVASGWSVKVIRNIVREEVQPTRDMAEYILRATGHWDEYIREREKAERDRNVIDSRRASVSPIYWRPE